MFGRADVILLSTRPAGKKMEVRDRPEPTTDEKIPTTEPDGSIRGLPRSSTPSGAATVVTHRPPPPPPSVTEDRTVPEERTVPANTRPIGLPVEVVRCSDRATTMEPVAGSAVVNGATGRSSAVRRTTIPVVGSLPTTTAG